MSQSNANSEPTMDEILASIRKIISEDQPETAEADRLEADEPSLPAEPSVELPLAASLAEPAADVEDQPVVMETVSDSEEPAVYEDESGFDDGEELEAEVYTSDSAIEGGFISESTREALDQAFDQIEEEPEPETEPTIPIPAGEGSVEVVFARAIQAAFDPTLQSWVDNNGDEIVSRLSPLIREWMDQNLPPLIEAAVTKEISRAVRARRR